MDWGKDFDTVARAAAPSSGLSLAAGSITTERIVADTITTERIGGPVDHRSTFNWDESGQEASRKADDTLRDMRLRNAEVERQLGAQEKMLAMLGSSMSLVAPKEFVKVHEEKLIANQSPGTVFPVPAKNGGRQWAVRILTGHTVFDTEAEARHVAHQVVSDVQRSARVEGYQLAIDGIWGPATDAAWHRMQLNRAQPPQNQTELERLARMVEGLPERRKPSVDNAMIWLGGNGKAPRTRSQPRTRTPMAQEEYERRYETVRAVLRPSRWWGWVVVATWHDGEVYELWWPTRRMADRSAQLVWRDQIRSLNRLYRAGQAQAILPPVGVTHLTKSEMEISLEQQKKTREAEMGEWDQEFGGTS